MRKLVVMTAFLFVLIMVPIFVIIFPRAEAISGVEIVTVIPFNKQGKVGDIVQVLGSINITNGLYRVWFGNRLVNETRAVVRKVDASFPIPHFSKGDYLITLQDYGMNINSTTVFTIVTNYLIAPSPLTRPKQLQQGNSTALIVNVTGGEPNKIYHANITVRLPLPLNTGYSTLVTLTNTTNTGDGSAIVTYPNQTLFQPSGSRTNYTGLYNIYFNATQNLAQSNFFVGLTNASEYHREEIVQIRAMEYQPNQTATVMVTFPQTNKTNSWSVNASQQGVIDTMWPVPSNASMGLYNVTITSGAPTKPIRDSQTFNILGYEIDVHTRNLAGNTVSQIQVEAFDKIANTTYSATSNGSGVASFHLEKGNHSLEAFWRKVKVGEIQSMTITEKAFYNLTCELANIEVTVKDENENLIPFVNLRINYTYVTTKESKKENGSVNGQTDIHGVFFVNSTLPHRNYTVNALRYQTLFNQNNNTILDLPAEEWFNVTILCPTKTLTLNITEYHRTPIPSAYIELIETMGGITYNKTTDYTGMAAINCTFGKYTAKVYADNILLNETSFEIFSNTYKEIHCKLYNLTLSVKIVDYFGQPIPNSNVTLQRDDLQNSDLANSDGTVTFSKIFGGNLQITVKLPGQTDPSVINTPYVDASKTIEIKLEKYVLFAGLLVETSQLITVIVILLILVLILSIEAYRWKRSKPQKSVD